LKAKVVPSWWANTSRPAGLLYSSTLNWPFSLNQQFASLSLSLSLQPSSKHAAAISLDRVGSCVWLGPRLLATQSPCVASSKVFAGLFFSSLKENPSPQLWISTSSADRWQPLQRRLPSFRPTLYLFVQKH
jgi:hypothetical protein